MREQPEDREKAHGFAQAVQASTIGSTARSTDIRCTVDAVQIEARRRPSKHLVISIALRISPSVRCVDLGFVPAPVVLALRDRRCRISQTGVSRWPQSIVWILVFSHATRNQPARTARSGRRHFDTRSPPRTEGLTIQFWSDRQSNVDVNTETAAPEGNGTRFFDDSRYRDYVA